MTFSVQIVIFLVRSEVTRGGRAIYLSSNGCKNKLWQIHCAGNVMIIVAGYAVDTYRPLESCLWFDHDLMTFPGLKSYFDFFFVHVTTWVTPFVNNKVKGLKCFCPILCPCLPSVSDPTNLGLLVSCRQPHQRLISPLTLTVFLRLLIVLKKWNQKMFYIMRFKDALINYFKHCCHLLSSLSLWLSPPVLSTQTV